MAGDIEVLRSGRDPRQLVAAAVEFAASEREPDHDVLLGFVNSAAFLLRLNSMHEYETSRPRRLRVAKVIRVLRDSPHRAAKVSLVRLAEGGDFVRMNWLCQELLVRALVSIRPSPPQAIGFWNEQSLRTAVNRHITIDMLCENGSDPAMALLEQKLLDPAQEHEYKVAWIRDSMLRHRNDEPLLRASERMIVETLPADLRLVLLEALCAYDRGWYPGCAVPKPPPRARATAPARRVLRRICRHALEHMELPVLLEAAVRATLLEIGDEDPDA